MLAWHFSCWRGALDFGVALQLLAWRFRCCRGASVVGVALQLLAWRFSCWRGVLDVGVAPEIAMDSAHIQLPQQHFMYGIHGHFRKLWKSRISKSLILYKT